MKKNLILLLGLNFILFSCKSDYQKLSKILQNSTWFDLTTEVHSDSMYFSTRMCNCLDSITGFHREQAFINSNIQDIENGFKDLENLKNRQTEVMQIVHGEGFIIDVSEKFRLNKYYLITIDDILLWEEKHDILIPSNAIILFYTGFESVEQDVEEIGFASFHSNTANFLVNNRKVRAVGTDAPQIDSHYWLENPSQKILCDAGVVIIERVDFIQSPPALGNYFMLLPFKTPALIGLPVKLTSIVPAV